MDTDKENVGSNKRNRPHRRESNVQSELCNRCGKTPRTKQSGKLPTISLTKPEKSTRTCKSRCKHKAELARFTNVSVTTLETGSESEGSFASTVSTRITDRSVRSIVRETTANKEIFKLQTMNAQLTSELHALVKGTKIRDLISAEYNDNTLTPNGDPVPLSVKINTSMEDLIAELNENVSNTTPTNSPSPSPKQQRFAAQQTDNLKPKTSDFTPQASHFTPQASHFQNSPQTSHFTPQASLYPAQAQHTTPQNTESVSATRTPTPPSKRANSTKSQPLPVSKTSLDSGYTSVKETRQEAWAGVNKISREMLSELEEENRALRVELKSSVSNTQDIILLEKEIRRLHDVSNEYKTELTRLQDIEGKLNQVEQFYHNEKKNFRCTIEDTLLTLEDFRQDKQDLEHDLMDVHDRLKGAEVKRKGLKEEIKEQKSILSNNIEKLKLELNTGQSENSMLQTRISTIEENCAFLEGQVQALERDNQEKLTVLTAAEQHAKDMEKDMGKLRKESVLLQSEQGRSEVLEGQIQDMKEHIDKLKTEKCGIQEKYESTHDQHNQLHTRLADLVKSHTRSEECVQQRDRTIGTLREQLEEIQSQSKAKYNEVVKDKESTSQNNKHLVTERDELNIQVQLLQNEIEYIEQAFFKGWSDQPEQDTSLTEDKTITFSDELPSSPAQHTRADRIIQGIKLDRQKLKAKLVRSVQDTKTLQVQLSETQDALERESGNLAKRLREALDELHERDMQGKVLERTAKNLSGQIEELHVVNRGLELENYHLKKLAETLSSDP